MLTDKILNWKYSSCYQSIGFINLYKKISFQLPPSVWLAGFFNPQSLLTAIMQSTARRHELPLDKMCLQCDVTKKNKEEFTYVTLNLVHLQCKYWLPFVFFFFFLFDNLGLRPGTARTSTGSSWKGHDGRCSRASSSTRSRRNCFLPCLWSTWERSRRTNRICATCTSALFTKRELEDQLTCGRSIWRPKTSPRNGHWPVSLCSFKLENDTKV